MIKHLSGFEKQEPQTQKSGELMDTCNDFILRNSLKQMDLLCMHWIIDLAGRKGRTFIESPHFLFSLNLSIISLFVDREWGPDQRLLSYAHMFTHIH